MIKFFSEKSERPHPSELVGRLVGKEGVMRFRSYSLPLLVTGYSGTRLFAKACVRIKDEIQPMDTRTEEVKFSVKSVAYVCDTEAEGEQIYQANLQAIAAWRRSQEEIKLEINSFFEAVSSDDSTFEPIEEPMDEDGFYDSSAAKPGI